jgi:hypothetical protein
MSYAAEIFTDHPSLTVLDQIDHLFVQKVVSASDYRPLLRDIREAEAQLNDPATDFLEVPLSDHRLVKVAKFHAPHGFAEGQRVRIVKRHLSPTEEIEVRAAARQQRTGLPYTKEVERVVADDPDLWEAHVALQRKGDVPRPVAKAAAPSRDTILKMAETLVAEAKAGTKREALAQLAQDHQEEPAYYNCYRWYQLGPGLDDHIRGAGR